MELGVYISYKDEHQQLMQSMDYDSNGSPADNRRNHAFTTFLPVQHVAASPVPDPVAVIALSKLQSFLPYHHSDWHRALSKWDRANE